MSAEEGETGWLGGNGIGLWDPVMSGIFPFCFCLLATPVSREGTGVVDPRGFGPGGPAWWPQARPHSQGCGWTLPF